MSREYTIKKKQRPRGFCIGGCKKKLVIILSTYFGVGFSPVAPGTCASIATIPLLFLLKDLHLFLRLSALLIIIFIGTIVSEYAQDIFKEDDPKKVVIDEVAGMLASCLFFPFRWRYILIAFFFFRLLDIFKPFPIKKLEKIKGGIGIMMDDIISGIISYLLVLIFIILFWEQDLKEFYSFLL